LNACRFYRVVSLPAPVGGNTEPASGAKQQTNQGLNQSIM